MRSAVGAAIGTVGLVVAIAGCERTRPASDTTNTSAATPTAATSPPGPSQAARLAGWNDTVAGPDLFVVGTNTSEAVVVLPRFTASLASAAAGNFTGSCTAWPTAHLATPNGPPPDWSVGFAAGHATSLPMDSMIGLAAVDSARRAAAIAHAASALPNDTAAAFRGLPFSVRDAHQFTLPSGDTVLAAEVVRRLNQEASPQEEHLLIVLERDTLPGPGGAAPPYIAAYSERVSGAEDDVESSEE